MTVCKGPSAAVISQLSKHKLLRDITDLEVEITKVPKTSVITWRDILDAHVGYPPATVMQRVERFARSRGVDLQVIPGIYD